MEKNQNLSSRGRANLTQRTGHSNKTRNLRHQFCAQACSSNLLWRRWCWINTAGNMFKICAELHKLLAWNSTQVTNLYRVRKIAVIFFTQGPIYRGCEQFTQGPFSRRVKIYTAPWWIFFWKSLQMYTGPEKSQWYFLHRDQIYRGCEQFTQWPFSRRVKIYTAPWWKFFEKSRIPQK